MSCKDISIRPEEHKDYRDIVSLILRSFREGTDYSDGTDIIALVEEIRDSQYYIPDLSFVAELEGKVVGHLLFSHFPLSPMPTGGHSDDGKSDIIMLAPVLVHADYFRQGIGSTMIKMGIEKSKQWVTKVLPSKEITSFITQSDSKRHQSSEFFQQAVDRWTIRNL